MNKPDGPELLVERRRLVEHEFELRSRMLGEDWGDLCGNNTAILQNGNGSRARPSSAKTINTCGQTNTSTHKLHEILQASHTRLAIRLFI
jgi:hypothetical protein